MELAEKIRAIVTDSLPESTANEMRKFIENTKVMEDELESRKARIVELKKELQDKSKIEDELNRLKELENSLVSKECELDERESLLEDRERGFKLELAELKIAMMGDKEIALFNLVDKVFSIPSVQVSNSKNILTPVPISDNGTIGMVQNDVVTETITTSKSK